MTVRCRAYLTSRPYKFFKNYRFIIVLSVPLLYYFGVFTMLLETDFKYFTYPLETNISKLVHDIRTKGETTVEPINEYNFTFIHDCRHKCSALEGQLRLVYVVKSARNNFERRKSIRNTWGFERRFSDVLIRTVFLVGSSRHPEVADRELEVEYSTFGDIVLVDFVDDYYNNTLKTMAGIKWATSYCNDSKFYFFSDDDMFVSTKNVLRYVRNPLEYPSYLEVPVASFQAKRFLKQVIDYELPDDVELFAGYVFPNSRPRRVLFSKWYIPLDEYKFNSYPAYVPAGSYILSREVLIKFFYASKFVKHFRFDDIYLAILAKKINIIPVHNDEFYFYKKGYDVLNYKYVIASHGFDDPKELEMVWTEQKSAGNA